MHPQSWNYILKIVLKFRHVILFQIKLGETIESQVAHA